MSSNPEYDRIVTIEQQPLDGAEPVPPEAPPSPAELPVQADPYYTLAAIAPQTPAIAPQSPTVYPGPIAQAPRDVSPRGRTRPRWAVPVAIAAVGLIASGALGYFLYTTSNRLDATRHQLAETQLTLDSTSKKLTSLQADAAAKKAVADYVGMYVNDGAKVETDYAQVAGCNTFSECRTAADAALTDLQAFQSDRKSATVPAALSSSDSQLGDSISAAIAAVQELISGMDSSNRPKIDDGFKKLNDAMLSVAKAESALGSEIR